jgi:hypothetical protein
VTRTPRRPGTRTRDSESAAAAAALGACGHSDGQSRSVARAEDHAGGEQGPSGCHGQEDDFNLFIQDFSESLSFTESGSRARIESLESFFSESPASRALGPGDTPADRTDRELSLSHWHNGLGADARDSCACIAGLCLRLTVATLITMMRLP